MCFALHQFLYLHIAPFLCLFIPRPFPPRLEALLREDARPLARVLITMAEWKWIVPYAVLSDHRTIEMGALGAFQLLHLRHLLCRSARPKHHRRQLREELHQEGFVLLRHALCLAGHDLVKVAAPFLRDPELIVPVGAVVVIIPGLEKVRVFIELLLAIPALPVAAANPRIDHNGVLVLTKETVPESGPLLLLPAEYRHQPEAGRAKAAEHIIQAHFFSPPFSWPGSTPASKYSQACRCPRSNGSTGPGYTRLHWLPPLSCKNGRIFGTSASSCPFPP